jgi:hypothetical protein
VKRALLVIVVAVGAVAACGPKRPPSGVDADDAIVRIKSNVPDANVFVDGRYYGAVKMLRGGLAFEAGRHRLELRHEDYFSRYVELELARRERKQLDLDLAPVLP